MSAGPGRQLPDNARCAGLGGGPSSALPTHGAQWSSLRVPPEVIPLPLCVLYIPWGDSSVLQTPRCTKVGYDVLTEPVLGECRSQCHSPPGVQAMSHVKPVLSMDRAPGAALSLLFSAALGAPSLEVLYCWGALWPCSLSVPHTCTPGCSSPLHSWLLLTPAALAVPHPCIPGCSSPLLPWLLLNPAPLAAPHPAPPAAAHCPGQTQQP